MKVTRRAMCEVCGTVREYTGTLDVPHLSCVLCGWRPPHRVIGVPHWADREAERADHDELAELLHLEGLLDALGIGRQDVADEDADFLYAVSWDSKRNRLDVWMNPTATTAGRVHAYRGALEVLRRLTREDRECGWTSFSLDLDRIPQGERDRFLLHKWNRAALAKAHEWATS